MKAWLVGVAILSVACAVGAQTNTDDSGDVMQSVEDWARDYLGDDVLESLKQAERDQVRGFFSAVQQQFEGTNVYRLVALKDSATKVLPLLEQYEETAPFAAWLKTRLDYLDAARDLQRGGRLSKSGPQLERDYWSRTMRKRSPPALAKTYVPRLKPVFAAGGAPAELVWLAEVESSFDPKARSPAGAAGLYQLMPDSARDQGLKVSWLHDDRLDPDKNARVAAIRLGQLHRHFGDWRLALAAFNAGENRVDVLLKNSPAKTFDAIAPRLPAETQMYVPKVEATLQRREGITLADLKAPKG